MSLRIYSLGTFRVEQGSEPIAERTWRTAKNRLLCKILLTYRRRPRTREQLCDWLWPDLAVEAAARNLRVAISHLRDALPPGRDAVPYILTTDAGYAWNPAAACWVDADAFTALAGTPAGPGALEAWQAARQLYQGDYLEEDRYADWALPERERLRDVYTSLLEGLAEAHARQGQYARAIALCRELLAVDRGRETVWQQLMLYYYHAGDQALALRAYEECRKALAADLGVEPQPALRALARQIRYRTVGGTPRYPPPSDLARLRHLPYSLGRTALAGRDAEYAQLTAALTAAAAGQGSLVLIEGEAGLGKTRLAEELLGYARQEGASVLEAACRELTAGQPYAPLLSALRLTDVPEEGLPAGARPAEARDARHAALATRILARGQPGRPVCLWLDDIHWADGATLAFLADLAPRLGTAAVLLMAGFRTEEVTAPAGGVLANLLWTLQRRQVLRRIRLAPLDRPAVDHLVQSTLGPAAPAIPWLYAETEGNPLFVVATLQALFEAGQIGPQVAPGPVAPPEPGTVPRGVQAVIAGRLQGLDPEARQALEAAAVLGVEFTWPALARMRTWRRDMLFEALDRLQAAWMVRPRGPEAYRFSHDKIRQAVYAAIPAEERRWLHGKAGEALLTVHAGGLAAVAGGLALHFEQAGRPDAALPYRLLAGRHAAGLYAHAEATEHYQAALALAADPATDAAVEARQEAHERLGDLAQDAGRYAEAAQHFGAALDLATTPAGRLRLLARLAGSHDRPGRRDLAGEFLRQAVAEAEHAGPTGTAPLEVARVYARWAIFNSGRHGRGRAIAYARRALALVAEPLSREAPDRLPWAEYAAIHGVLINAGEALRYWQAWDEAADLFARALALAERQGEREGIGFASHNAGDVLLARGDLEGARAAYTHAAAAFAEAGLTWEAMASHTSLAVAWACGRDWPAAAAALATAARLGESIEPTTWLAEVYLWRALVALCLADPAPAAIHRARAAVVAAAAGRPLPRGFLHLLAAVEADPRGCAPAAARDWAAARAFLAKPAHTFYARWLLQALSAPGAG